MKDESGTQIEQQEDEVLSQILLYRTAFIREANETDWQHYLNSLIGGNAQAILSLSQATYTKQKEISDQLLPEEGKNNHVPVVLKPHMSSSSSSSARHRTVLKEANRLPNSDCMNTKVSHL